ncbi:MAG TPA: RICIN domain-containing protein, partial [Longimicrobium sp.]|nr:RICIN domain-containing protein [Longimicrobium sp.]
GHPGRRGAGAYSLAITAGSLCLTPDGDRDGAPVRLRPCAEGGAMFRIENGYVATAGGRCLDWGDPGGPIHLMPCKPGRPERSSQQWYFHGNKLVQNALRDDICMDVQGERIQAGTPVIAYACRDYRQPPSHQRFYPGGQYSFLSLPPGIRQALQQAGGGPEDPAWVLMSDGSRVISAGGGNVISAGGGNVISAGSGNVISAGGGNVVSAGGLNLRVVNDPGQLLRGAQVISAGSGNVVSAGGLN